MDNLIEAAQAVVSQGRQWGIRPAGLLVGMQKATRLVSRNHLRTPIVIGLIAQLLGDKFFRFYGKRL